LLRAPRELKGWWARPVDSLAGSGKTAAFLVPLITRVQRLRATRAPGRATLAAALVLSPTRELALQTFNFFKTYSKFTELTGCPPSAWCCARTRVPSARAR